MEIPESLEYTLKKHHITNTIIYRGGGTVGIKHFLALKFPKYFESETIKNLKKLGVNFNEDLPGNFVPVKGKQVKNIIKKVNTEEIICRLNKKDV